MATLEDSTFSEKHFLSGLTESAAASTASVRTGSEDAGAPLRLLPDAG